MPFPLSRWKLDNYFVTIQNFFLFAKSLLAVDLQLSEVSCSHAGWRPIIKQYLINWYTFALTMISSEYFGENGVILLQTVAKWRCIKLCAIFFWTTLYIPSSLSSFFQKSVRNKQCLLLSMVCLHRAKLMTERSINGDKKHSRWYTDRPANFNFKWSTHPHRSVCISSHCTDVGNANTLWMSEC